MTLRKRLLIYFVRSVVLYSAETWTLRKEEENFLESFEIWLWQKIEKLDEHVTNEEEYEKTCEYIVRNVRWRKVNWSGQILRKDRLQKLIIRGNFSSTKKRIFSEKRPKMKGSGIFEERILL